jgi:hypothetical protein
MVAGKKIYPTADSPVMPVTAEIRSPKSGGRDKIEVTRGANKKNWDLAKSISHPGRAALGRFRNSLLAVTPTAVTAVSKWP